MKTLEDAIDSFQAALARQPDSADSLIQLGIARRRAGFAAEAVRLLTRALVLAPQSGDLHRALGDALVDVERYVEAAACYCVALAEDPSEARLHYNLGVALMEPPTLETAAACFRQAILLDPGMAFAYSNLAYSLRDLGWIPEADRLFRRATAITPDHAEFQWNEGLALLALGDYRAGWEKYEWRWRMAAAGLERNFPQPPWRGEEDLAGRTILLHAEQGFGDTLQFIRYAPMVAALGATVVVEVQPALRRLITAMPGDFRVIAKGEPLPPFDLHCPLLSLPLAFGTRVETIPAQVPYLPLLGEPAGEGLRIGLVWSGKRDQRAGRYRAMAFEQILPLTALPGATFVSLQKEIPPGDEAALGRAAHVARLGETVHDFADTAALIAGLDLVITIDTSVAHLAGALGKPVWVMLHRGADWRWFLDRADSPWYPTARLFRQSRAGDWSDVIDEVGQALSGSSALSL